MKIKKRVSYKEANTIAENNGFSLWYASGSWCLEKNNTTVLCCRLPKEVKDYINTEKQVIKHIYKFEKAVK